MKIEVNRKRVIFLAAVCATAVGTASIVRADTSRPPVRRAQAPLSAVVTDRIANSRLTADQEYPQSALDAAVLRPYVTCRTDDCSLPLEVTVDGARISDQVLAQKVVANWQAAAARARMQKKNVAAAPPPASDPQILRSAVAVAVLNRLLYTESIANGRAVSKAVARAQAQRNLQRYISDNSKAKAGVVPPSRTPESVFLSDAAITGLQIGLSIAQERQSVITASRSNAK